MADQATGLSVHGQAIIDDILTRLAAVERKLSGDAPAPASPEGGEVAPLSSPPSETP